MKSRYLSLQDLSEGASCAFTFTILRPYMRYIPCTLLGGAPRALPLSSHPTTDSYFLTKCTLYNPTSTSFNTKSYFLGRCTSYPSLLIPPFTSNLLEVQLVPSSSFKSAIMPPTDSEEPTMDFGDSYPTWRRDRKLPARLLLAPEAPPDFWHRLRGKMKHSGCEDPS